MEKLSLFLYLLFHPLSTRYIITLYYSNTKIGIDGQIEKNKSILFDRSHVVGRTWRQFLRISPESVDPIRQGGRRGPANVRRSDRGHRSTHDQDVAGQAPLRVRLEIRQAGAQNGSSGVFRG